MRCTRRRRPADRRAFWILHRQPHTRAVERKMIYEAKKWQTEIELKERTITYGVSAQNNFIGSAGREIKRMVFPTIHVLFETHEIFVK